LLMLQEDCYIYLYPHSKVMIAMNVFHEVWSLHLKDGVQLLYHQATPSYLTCLGGGAKIQEGRCFSCSLVQFELISFLFFELITYSNGRSDRFREVFSRDPSIHPSIPSSIHGWHHTRKKTLAEINKPPLRMCNL
jgi:hypothetical protein